MKKANLTHNTLLRDEALMLSPMVMSNAFFCFGNSESIFNNSSTKTSNLMKKVNFKMVLMALSVMFTFLFVGVGTASAQQATDQGIYAPAPGNFMNTDEAGVTLLQQIDVLGNQLGNYDPGTPLYNSTRRQALYYRGIYMELQNGNSVAASIGLGFFNLNDTNGNGDLSKVQLYDLRQQAIDLLSQ